MGIVSLLPKVVGYGKRALKVAPDFILGTGSEVAGAALKTTKGSIWAKAKAAGKAVEGMKKSGSFWTRATANLGLIKSSTMEGIKLGAAKGGFFSKLVGGTKGLFKGLGKNMPFLAAASTLLFELPNIWTATKEKGAVQGIKEVGKAGARLAGGAAGAAIGSAICPGIGTVAGWFLGDWLTSKVVGKSYTEQKEEAEQALAQNQQEITPVEYSNEDLAKLRSYGMTNEEIAQASQNGFTVQDIDNLLASQEATPQKTAQVEENQNTTTNQNDNLTYQTQFPSQYTYNPMQTFPNLAYANGYNNQYSTDMFYQQTFGASPTTNPFDFSQQTKYFKYQA